jgi:hypothetical protein
MTSVASAVDALGRPPHDPARVGVEGAGDLLGPNSTSSSFKPARSYKSAQGWHMRRFRPGGGVPRWNGADESARSGKDRRSAAPPVRARMVFGGRPSEAEPRARDGSPDGSRGAFEAGVNQGWL